MVFLIGFIQIHIISVLMPTKRGLSFGQNLNGNHEIQRQVRPQIENPRYEILFHFFLQLSVNRKLNVLANLPYYNLSSCSIICTEETEQEEYPQEFLRMHLKTRNKFPTSFFVAENCRYVTRVLCSAVLEHGRRKTWELTPQLSLQILHFRPFSYHLHATVILNSTPLCKQPYVSLRPQFTDLVAYINFTLVSCFIKFYKILIKSFVKFYKTEWQFCIAIYIKFYTFL